MEPNVLLPDEITGEMLLNQNIKEIPTLLEPLLPKSGLVCLAGSSDTGKSAFLRQLGYVRLCRIKDFSRNETQCRASQCYLCIY